MVASPAWLPEVPLPTMTHLMHEGTQDVLVRPIHKRIGVERQLMGGSRRVLPMPKAIRGKVAAALGFALQGNEARRELAPKKLRIKPVIREIGRASCRERV